MLRLVDLANNQDLDDPNADPWDYDVESIDKAKLLSDPRVLADMRRLYEIEGGNFDSEEDMVNHWYRTLTGASVNIPIAAWELGSALNDDAETKHIKSRLARVHSHMPNPGEEGHPGWDEFAKGYGHAVWDPTNWFGASLALKGLRGAAVAGKIAKGKTVTSAVGKKGVGRAALYEGAISGAQEGALNAAGQARDISIGVRDRFSKSDFAPSWIWRCTRRCIW